MDWHRVASTFAVIFLAEMGDKTVARGYEDGRRDPPAVGRLPRHRCRPGSGVGPGRDGRRSARAVPANDLGEARRRAAVHRHWGSGLSRVVVADPDPPGRAAQEEIAATGVSTCTRMSGAAVSVLWIVQCDTVRSSA